jgi:hypothetical protein
MSVTPAVVEGAIVLLVVGACLVAGLRLGSIENLARVIEGLEPDLIVARPPSATTRSSCANC